MNHDTEAVKTAIALGYFVCRYCRNAASMSLDKIHRHEALCSERPLVASAKPREQADGQRG